MRYLSINGVISIAICFCLVGAMCVVAGFAAESNAIILVGVAMTLPLLLCGIMVAFVVIPLLIIDDRRVRNQGVGKRDESD
jgi:hypothetical protein